MDIGLSAIIFDMSLIIYSTDQRVINWNLTPIKKIGIVVAVHYASNPVK